MSALAVEARSRPWWGPRPGARGRARRRPCRRALGRAGLAAICALFVSGLTGVWAGAASAAAAKKAPKGNAKAIAFERSAYKVDNAASSYVEFEYGYVSYFAQHTPGDTQTTVELSYGTGKVPNGWAPANVEATFGLHDGRIAWIFAVLNSPTGNANKYVQFVVDGSGTQLTVVTTPTAFPGLCYKPVTSANFTPWTHTIGKPLFHLAGDFRRPPKNGKIHGKSYTYVTYSYKGFAKRHVTETDGFTSKTKAATTFRIEVAAKGKSHPAFTITGTWLANGGQPEPTVSSCPA